jgi:hypothetical protein
VTKGADHPRSKGNSRFPRLFDLVRFVFFSSLLFLIAWIAATGRVVYVFMMLLIAAALSYASSISSTAKS